LLAYTKFTFKEFRVCVRAIFAFAGGYKLGERYLLGELERRHGQSAAGAVQTSLVGTVQGMMASERAAFAINNDAAVAASLARVAMLDLRVNGC
jgi:hypothetical protein